MVFANLVARDLEDALDIRIRDRCYRVTTVILPPRRIVATAIETA